MLRNKALRLYFFEFYRILFSWSYCTTLLAYLTLSEIVFKLFKK